MPSICSSINLSRAASSLKGLMIAVISFIGLALKSPASLNVAPARDSELAPDPATRSCSPPPLAQALGRPTTLQFYFFGFQFSLLGSCRNLATHTFGHGAGVRR